MRRSWWSATKLVMNLIDRLGDVTMLEEEDGDPRGAHHDRENVAEGYQRASLTPFTIQKLRRKHGRRQL